MEHGGDGTGAVTRVGNAEARHFSLSASDLLHSPAHSTRKAKKSKKKNKVLEEGRLLGDTFNHVPSTYDGGDRRKAKDGTASKWQSGRPVELDADNSRGEKESKHKVVNLCSGDSGADGGPRQSRSQKPYSERNTRSQRPHHTQDSAATEVNVFNFFTVTTPLSFDSLTIQLTSTPAPATFDLSALWEAFKEPSIFGCEVPFLDAQKQYQHCTYVPYLSAVQLFKKVDQGAPEQVFEYFETAPPHKRRCLHPMIQLLMQKHPEVSPWLLGANAQLAASSWFAILWVSVPRDVQQPNTSLLVYHKFLLSAHRLERFGVVSYRADAQMWPTVAPVSAEQMADASDKSLNGQMHFLHCRLLEWMHLHKIAHPDFEFFRARCER